MKFSKRKTSHGKVEDSKEEQRDEKIKLFHVNNQKHD